jgi:hypothetical protein
VDVTSIALMDISGVAARFLSIATVALVMASGCTAEPSHTAGEPSRTTREEPPTSSPNEPCSDLIDANAAAPSPPGPVASDVIYLGSGDTFFRGLQGRRWGDVEYWGGAFHTKIAIWTLDSHPPKVSVIRLDGLATGAAEFAPTSEGLPGPLPTDLSFPTAGCWKVEARGTTGVASIQVNVQAPLPSSGS